MNQPRSTFCKGVRYRAAIAGLLGVICFATEKPAEAANPGQEQVSKDFQKMVTLGAGQSVRCLLYTSPSPRDLSTSRMPSSA